MPRNPSEVYKWHVVNLRELGLAIENTARLAREAIANKNKNSLRTLLRLYAFLLGAWAETRLKKLLHEEYGFSDSERGYIESQDTQMDQWQHTVDCAFRKLSGIAKAHLNENTLGVTKFARYKALHDTLDNDLRIIIEIRNKLAHGQWIYPLNNAGNNVENNKYLLINDENLQSLQSKFALINHLADAIHDLVVSPRTFDRDFENHFRKLLQVRMNLVKKDYQKFEANLIAKEERARASRRASQV